VTGQTDTICKVRGITPNYSAKQLVNFDVIKDMILDAESTVTVYTEKEIKRKRKGEGELWPLSKNPRIRRTESRSSNADV